MNEPKHPDYLPPLPFKHLIGACERLKVLDIGANPLDGDTPPYANLLAAGDIDLVGFEPHAPSLETLNAKKGPHETYLPYAVGDGRPHTLRICHAPGLSSLYQPNPAVMRLFHLFPVWSRVFSRVEVPTHRLDDIPETDGADFIKIDIQGAELMVFEGGVNRLANVSVIQTEVSFLPLYQDQPLFSEVELFLRKQGFMFHRFFPLDSRMISPFIRGTDIYGKGLGQVMQADAVFVRDFSKLETLTSRHLIATATLMHECYNSFDAALYMLVEFDRRHHTNLHERYLNGLKPSFPNEDVWMWSGPRSGPAQPRA